MIIFVGERRSNTAIRLGYTWHDGHLAAKQLFEALDFCGIDRTGCQFVNWWEQRGSRALIQNGAALGFQIVAMGRKVERELVKAGIPHTFIVHPAARGEIRAKAKYFAHVKQMLQNGGCYGET